MVAVLRDALLVQGRVIRKRFPGLHFVVELRGHQTVVFPQRTQHGPVVCR